MLFHTLEFLVLFAIVYPFALWGNSTVRRVTMLVASYAFYMWFSVPLVGLLVFSTCLDFSIGKRLHLETDPLKRKLLLAVSLVGNLGMLFYFKYTNWFLGSINSVSHMMTGNDPFPLYDIILPLGISFYTFQTLSYTIDIYRGTLKPTKSLLTFALYVAFFPQLVAGPIVRAAALVGQLDDGPRFRLNQFRHGVGCFFLGLVKKMVIADNLAFYVNSIYESPYEHGTLTLLLATYAFAFQIYCDFSGYTDMARGIAFMLGYDVGVNFNFPYFARGVRDFWRRWHISLSTWLRDYLYISLGGNRCSRARTNFNVFATMLLGGLWHGANWRFVVWGAIHGAWIVIEQTIADRRGNGKIRGETKFTFAHLLMMMLSFHMVCLTWIFFRADTVGQAWGICRQLFVWGDSATAPLEVFYYIVPVVIIDWIAYKTSIRTWLVAHRWPFWLLVWVAIGIVLAFGQFRGEDFVYFQF